MYSLLFLVLFVGCYLLYITSKKAKLGRVPSGFIRLAHSTKKAKVIAGVLFLLSWFVIIMDQGFGSGTFAFGGYIMAVLGTILLLNPLQYVHWRHLLGLFVLCILFEILIF